MAAPCETVCDGAAVPYLTEEFYPTLASPVYRTALVPGEDTLATSRDILLSLKILTELSGCAGDRRCPSAKRYEHRAVEVPPL